MAPARLRGARLLLTLTLQNDTVISVLDAVSPYVFHEAADWAFGK